MHDTAQSTSSALNTEQISESGVDESALGASVLSKLKWAEAGVGYLVRDGMCLLLQQVLKAADEAE